MSKVKTLLFVLLLAAIAVAAWLAATPRGDEHEVVAPPASSPKLAQTIVPADPVAPSPAASFLAAGPKIVKPRSSFESSSDIWEFAESRVGSGDSGELYEAWRASRECEAIADHAAAYQNYVSGVPSAMMPGGYRVERQAAASALISHCLGFLKHGKPESSVLTAKLRAEGVASGGAEFQKLPPPSGASESTERFRKLASPAARADSLLLLLPLADEIAQRDFPDKPNKEDLVDGAVMLALCDLGRDCSKNSYGYLLLCAKGDKCGDSLWDGWSSEVSQEDAEAINAIKARIVSGVKGN